VQAKQEEEQLKVQEEVKRRQEAIRKKEEEAAQRRYLYIIAPLLSWTWPVTLKPSHDSYRQCLLHDWQLLHHWSMISDWHVSMKLFFSNCLL